MYGVGWSAWVPCSGRRGGGSGSLNRFLLDFDGLPSSVKSRQAPRKITGPSRVWPTTQGPTRSTGRRSNPADIGVTASDDHAGQELGQEPAAGVRIGAERNDQPRNSPASSWPVPRQSRRPLTDLGSTCGGPITQMGVHVGGGIDPVSPHCSMCYSAEVDLQQTDGPYAL